MSTGHLVPYLNRNDILKVDILAENYIVECLRAMYFHLNSCYPFECNNGKFTIKPHIATYDYTPSVLNSLLKIPLSALSDLYYVKKFVNRESQSSLTSVLQEAIQKCIVLPFYSNLEDAMTDKILDFNYKMKKHFQQIRSILTVVLSPRPADKIFQLASCGNMLMIKMSAHALYYYHDIIKNSLSVSNSALLTSDDFFVRQTETGVELHDVPSPFPSAFVEDIKETCLAILIKSAPTKIDLPSEDIIIQSDITQANANLLSFEVLLPESIPESETPAEEIAAFRAAAWSLQLPPRRKIKQQQTDFKTLDEAVQTIILKPLWGLAKSAQKSLVEFLNMEQRLPDVCVYLANLYLMRRGDLHTDILTGKISQKGATQHFKQKLGSIPFFDFRFTNDGIICVLPIRLRRIITQAQISVYNRYYKLMRRLKELYLGLANMPFLKRLLVLRMNLIQFLVALMQLLFTRVNSGLFEMVKEMERAENLDSLIKSHSKFVSIIDTESLENSAEFGVLFDIGFDVASKRKDVSSSVAYDLNQSFMAFKAALFGKYALSAKKDPDGPAAGLLYAIGIHV